MRWRAGDGGIDWGHAAVLAALIVPIVLLWPTWAVYPLKILVVYFHELSHGVAAILTSGAVDHIEVVAEQGGLCVTRGGSRFLTLSAGYLGSLAWGGAALVLAIRGRRHRAAAFALGALVLLGTLAWVRPLASFGFAFHLGAGLAIVAAALWLPGVVSAGLLEVFGLTSCLYVVPDIYSDTIARSGEVSDARMLAELTHVPTVVWGGLWIVTAVLLTAAILGWSLRARAAAPAPPPAPLMPSGSVR